jgi:hypothetical protein
MKSSLIFCQIFNKTSAPSQSFAIFPDIKFKENPFSLSVPMGLYCHWIQFLGAFAELRESDY